MKNKLLNEDVEKLKSAQASGLKTELIQKATVINDKILIAEVVDVDSKKAKDLSFQIKSEIENSVVLLIVLNNGKVIAQDTPSKLVNDINAKNAYFGESFSFK